MHLVKQDKNDSLEHLKIICVWRYVAMNFMLMWVWKVSVTLLIIANTIFLLCLPNSLSRPSSME